MSPQENLEHKNRVIRIPLFDVVAEHQGELPKPNFFEDTAVRLTTHRERNPSHNERQFQWGVDALAMNFDNAPTFFLHSNPLSGMFYSEKGSGSVRVDLDIFSLKPTRGLVIIPDSKEDIDIFIETVLPEIFTKESMSVVNEAARYVSPINEGLLRPKNVSAEAVVSKEALQSTFQRAMGQCNIHSPETILRKIEETKAKLPDQSKKYLGLHRDLYDLIWAASTHRHFFTRKENRKIWQNLSELIEQVSSRKAATKSIAHDAHVEKDIAREAILADFSVILETAESYRAKGVK